MRDLICSGLEILLVMIRMEVTGLKETRWYTSWTCLGGGERRMVQFGVCEAPLDDWANGGPVDIRYKLFSDIHIERAAVV